MDIAKGIGIIFVLIGHTYSGLLWKFAFSFHMPLFFIISGFFFKFWPDKRQYILKNVKALVYPYWFIVILWALYSLFQNPNGRDWLLWIGGGVYGTGMGLTEPFYVNPIYGLWFFLALFWAKTILNSMDKLPEFVQSVVVISLGYWGVVSFRYFNLPVCIQNGCLALVFLYIGFIVRKYSIIEKLNGALYLLCFLIWIMGIHYEFGLLSVVACSASLVSCITSCCGTLVVIGFSKIMELGKIASCVFRWLGRRTAIIFAFHIFELHSGVCSQIAQNLFHTGNIHVIFAIRCIWCALFAFAIPYIQYVNTIFGIKRERRRK